MGCPRLLSGLYGQLYVVEVDLDLKRRMEQHDVKTAVIIPPKVKNIGCEYALNIMYPPVYLWLRAEQLNMAFSPSTSLQPMQPRAIPTEHRRLPE